MLSAEAQKVGFQVFPIDHAHNRFRPLASIFQIDISSPNARELLPQMFQHVKPRWCHMGLPCGTASRARERPIKESLRRAGAPQPRPLRSAEHLLGLPGLTPFENAKVCAANEVYRVAESLIFQIFLLGAILTLENPERSWLWAILALLVKQRNNEKYTQWYFDLENVSFDNCMHGGAYPKATRLRANPGVFQELAVKCDNSHTHAMWGIEKRDGLWVFDTANEAAYPRVLAARMVQCVVRTLPSELLQSTYKQYRLDSLKQADTQTHRHGALIPEYREIVHSHVPPPAHHKLLELPWPSGEQNEGSQMGTKYGIYFTPWEHLEMALRLDHPASTFKVVPDALRINIFEVFVKGLDFTAQKRIQALKDMAARKEALKLREEELRANMPEHVRVVTEGKALCLFRELLTETGFPDLEVCNMMENGVSLTGAEPTSPLYMKKFSPATLTLEQLDNQAVWRRKALMGKPITEDEMAQETDMKNETMAEVQAGFLQGPFSPEEISKRIGSEDWSLTKRFLLYQGEDRKIRIIDNYRDSAVNSAFSSSSYLALQDTDFVIGLLRFLMQVCSNRNEVVVQLSDGTCLRGEWHRSVKGRPEVWARCVDLSKAYKQVAIDTASLKHGVLGYQTSSGAWELYTTQSLPFGASASVFAFNKISRAIWHLMVCKLGIWASVFYDDYPVFELEPLAALTTKVLDTFFSLLGWRHAVVGKKAVDFAQQFVALGVQYNLGAIWKGELSLCNKAGRLQRIKSLAAELVELKVGLKASMASLAGLLNFAGGFVLGHSFKPATHLLNQWSANMVPEKRQREELCELISVLVDSAEPRIVSKSTPSKPILIYTDGAFENGVATWGALVIDVETGCKWIFSGKVPDFLVQHWLRTVEAQIICEVETFAYVCVRWHCRKLLFGRFGICFIDNEASRISLIKRSSRSRAMFALVNFLSLVDSQAPFMAWIERVPTHSNPADLPSRGCEQELADKTGAENLGDICLPGFILNFLCSREFHKDLANVIIFESAV